VKSVEETTNSVPFIFAIRNSKKIDFLSSYDDKIRINLFDQSIERQSIPTLFLNYGRVNINIILHLFDNFSKILVVGGFWDGQLHFQSV